MVRRRLAVLAALLSLATATGVLAQVTPNAPDASAPAKFAVVVYNENDPLAAPLAKYYAEKRGIPAERIVALQCPLSEEISREQYDREIAEPLRRAFDRNSWWERATNPASAASPGPVSANRIRYLVLMRGMPLKIAQLTTKYPGDDPGPQPEGIRSVNAASVDSELAVLGRFSHTISGFQPNPYFRGYSRIIDTNFPGIMLVGRLDGPSDVIVRRMIDDSLAAERDGLWGRVYIDARGLGPESGPLAQGDAWLTTAAKEADLPVVLDKRAEMFETGYPMREVAVYLGWYSGGVAGPFTRPDFRFEPGAIAVHIHSFSAATIHSVEQGWVGPLLAKGAAASCGNVYEPYLLLTVHLDIFLNRLGGGFTLAESAYMAMPALSWMGTVVGDPLYRPFKVAQELGLRADFGDINPEVDFKAPLSLAEEMRAFVTVMHQRRSKPANVIEAELIKYGRKYRSGRIYEGLGLFQFANGNAVDAARTFGTARDLYVNPEDVQRVTMHEARALAKGGNKPRALALLRAAMAKNPTSPALESLRAVERELEPPAAPEPTPMRRVEVGTTVLGRPKSSNAINPRLDARRFQAVAAMFGTCGDTRPYLGQSRQHQSHLPSRRELDIITLPRMTSIATLDPTAGYAALVDGRAVRETPAPAALTEIEWQARWFAGDFGTHFTDTDGRAVEIVQFGVWNRGAGPDFLDAAVRFDDGPPQRGAIELDLDAVDWERHGHAINPDFENVVLHLFATESAARESFTRTALHRLVPRVRLDLARLEDGAPGRDGAGQARALLRAAAGIWRGSGGIAAARGRAPPHAAQVEPLAAAGRRARGRRGALSTSRDGARLSGEPIAVSTAGAAPAAAPASRECRLRRGVADGAEWFPAGTRVWRRRAGPPEVFARDLGAMVAAPRGVAAADSRARRVAARRHEADESSAAASRRAGGDRARVAAGARDPEIEKSHHRRHPRPRRSERFLLGASFHAWLGAAQLAHRPAGHQPHRRDPGERDLPGDCSRAGRRPGRNTCGCRPS